MQMYIIARVKKSFIIISCLQLLVYNLDFSTPDLRKNIVTE